MIKFCQLGNEVADAAAWPHKTWPPTIIHLQNKIKHQVTFQKQQWKRIYDDLYVVGVDHANYTASTQSSVQQDDPPELGLMTSGQPLALCGSS